MSRMFQDEFGRYRNLLAKEKSRLKPQVFPTLKEIPEPEAFHEDADGTVRLFDIKNLKERVTLIAYLAKKYSIHPVVHETALAAVNRRCGPVWCVPSKDHHGEIRAIFDWMRGNVRYVNDPYNVDLFQSPVRTIKVRGGDCDDHSSLIASMMLAIGKPAFLRVVRTKDSEEPNHIYPVVLYPPDDPKHVIALDTTEDHRDMGWESPDVVEWWDFPVGDVNV